MTIPEPIQQVPAHPDNYTTSRLGYRVQGIIIHTIVGTLESADATFQNPNRMASAHYGIACDGSVIHQYVSEADIAWHCGRFYPDAGHPLGNANTIGIEHCDNGNYNGVRSDGLYKTSSDLVRDICHRYGIAINRTQIRKHREVSEQPTSCPDALDIDRIVTMAAGAPAPAPSTGDVDVLYVGPIHAFNASFKTFAAGASYPDPVAVTVMGQSLASGATVVVDAYSYSSAPV